MAKGLGYSKDDDARLREEAFRRKLALEAARQQIGGVGLTQRQIDADRMRAMTRQDLVDAEAKAQARLASDMAKRQANEDKAYKQGLAGVPLTGGAMSDHSDAYLMGQTEARKQAEAAALGAIQTNVVQGPLRDAEGNIVYAPSELGKPATPLMGEQVVHSLYGQNIKPGQGLMGSSAPPPAAQQLTAADYKALTAQAQQPGGVSDATVQGLLAARQPAEPAAAPAAGSARVASVADDLAAGVKPPDKGMTLQPAHTPTTGTGAFGGLRYMRLPTGQELGGVASTVGQAITNPVGAIASAAPQVAAGLAKSPATSQVLNALAGMSPGGVATQIGRGLMPPVKNSISMPVTAPTSESQGYSAARSVVPMGDIKNSISMPVTLPPEEAGAGTRSPRGLLTPRSTMAPDSIYKRMLNKLRGLRASDMSPITSGVHATRG